MGTTRCGRTAAVATLAATAPTVGATTTAAAAPAPDSPSPSAATQPAGDSLVLDAGALSFARSDDSLDVRNADGDVVESIPPTLPGTGIPVPVDFTVGDAGRTLTVDRVEADAVGRFNKLVGQWPWGVQNGGAAGAAIGSFVGCWPLVFGCVPGLVLGGALGSPNTAQMQQTFIDMIADK